MRRFVLLTLLLVRVATADALDEYARPIKDGEVFYRWQSNTAADNMLRVGIMTPALNQHFMGHEGAAGPGMYVAGTETSSASFLPKAGGKLIELRFAPGTRVIDLSDHATKIELENRGFDLEALLRDRSGGQPVVIKYEDDWFVGKNLVDRVTFGTYPGPTQTAARIADAMTRVHEGVLETEAAEAAAEQIARQVIAHRPELVPELTAMSDLHPALLRAQSPAEADAAIRTAATRGVSPRAAAHLTRFLERDAAARARLARDPATFDRVADVVVEHLLPRLPALSAREHRLLTKMTVDSPGDAKARLARLSRVVDESFDHALAWGDADWVTRHARPFVVAASLTSDQRKILGERLSRFARANPRPSDAAAGAVADLRALVAPAETAACVATILRAR